MKNVTSFVKSLISEVQNLNTFNFTNFLLLTIFTFYLLLSTFNSKAQDIHFSQFTMIPLQLDPSLAGKFGGDQRAIINYRNQWSSVASPFKTYGFSFDTHFKLKKQKDNFFGTGISVYSDKAGDINLGLTTVNLTLAYHIRLNESSYLSLGLQGGFLQSSLSEGNLRFGNQFDGSGHNNTYGSGEVFKHTSFFQPDFSGGVSYSFGTNTTQQVISDNGFDGKKITVGAAIHHVNSPNYSFLQTTNKEKLNFRYLLHANTSFGVRGTNMAIQPSGFIAYQQKAIDFVIGSYFRYNLKAKSKYTKFSNGAALSLGAHYRIGDALIASLLVETGSFAFGVSYDLNLSGLSAASNGQGGFEFSMRYLSPNPFVTKKSRARFF